ncbi:hypothetical protein [Halotalea alkalilenta]|uniref:Uncharacterized protein n=1 Tax=Halotalea alkalilenta TaxID=376489 RepID=A0A172YF15_9GAMM|nr:hypothetical protein [Halotalea alkalilenta]ANF57555.1 hypothetical protein A5892_08835 [Halotalea alkalilenta]
MTTSSEMQQARVIKELRGFIKKLLYDPSILPTALEIARRHSGEKDAAERIAEEISSTTSVKIPTRESQHSPADKLFLALLKEVIEEERALY